MIDQQRPLIKHGVFLVFIGLVNGLFIPYVTNPRMGLSAHLEGVTAGMLLVLMGGCVWQYLNLSERMARMTYYLLLYSCYGTWAGTLFAALLGTSQATPIAGAGFGASEGREAFVGVFLLTVVVSILVAFCLLLYGLRGKGNDVQTTIG